MNYYIIGGVFALLALAYILGLFINPPWEEIEKAQDREIEEAKYSTGCAMCDAGKKVENTSFGSYHRNAGDARLTPCTRKFTLCR